MRKEALAMSKWTFPPTVTLPACLAAIVVASLGLAWADAARSDTGFVKYEKGESTATVYPDLNNAKIGDIGQ
jgi:hypothetical protein